MPVLLSFPNDSVAANLNGRHFLSSYNVDKSVLGLLLKSYFLTYITSKYDKNLESLTLTVAS